jgi:hypothetical protein
LKDSKNLKNYVRKGKQYSCPPLLLPASITSKAARETVTAFVTTAHSYALRCAVTLIVETRAGRAICDDGV